MSGSLRRGPDEHDSHASLLPQLERLVVLLVCWGTVAPPWELLTWIHKRVPTGRTPDSAERARRPSSMVRIGRMGSRPTTGRQCVTPDPGDDKNLWDEAGGAVMQAPAVSRIFSRAHQLVEGDLRTRGQRLAPWHRRARDSPWQLRAASGSTTASHRFRCVFSHKCGISMLPPWLTHALL